MKVLMSTLIALSVLATITAPASATFQGNGSRVLKEKLQNCAPATECQPIRL